MIQPNSRHNARSQLTVPASANPSEMRKTRRLEEINYTLVSQRQIFQEILKKNLENFDHMLQVGNFAILYM